MEFIIINGVPVPVPREVVSEGRDAVSAWHDDQTSQPSAPASAPAVPSTAKE